MILTFRSLVLTSVFWQMMIISTVISQSGYSKIFSIENSLSLDIDDVLYHNDQLIVRGNSYIDSVNIWGLFIAGLDTNGIVLWYNTIYDSTRMSHIISNTPTRLFITEEERLIVPTKYFNNGHIVVFITDSVGHKLFSLDYQSNERWIKPEAVIQSNNSIYIFGIVQRENYLNDNFIIKSDSTGNLLWIKFYGSDPENENFGDVIDNLDGTMTISSSIYTKNYYSENTVQGWKKPWIFTIDTAGTIIDEWKGVINDPRTLGGGPFYHSPEGNWIITSFDLKEIPYSEFISYVYTSPSISKLDSNFNLIWKINLTDYTGRFDLITDLKYDSIQNEFILAGDRDVIYSPSYSESEAWVVKVNSEGEIVWVVTDTLMNNQQEELYTAGLALSPSGSIYIAGWVYLNRSDGWIIKVTPDGCSDTICTTTSIKKQILGTQNKVLIYPNPVNDELTVLLKELTGKKELLMFDLFGRLVLEENLNHDENKIRIDLPTGIYFYTVGNNNTIIKTGKLIVN